ncbi:type I restriction-modification system subunit M [Mycoplasmoides fastidiosum]|uniref:type I restriction-modification system subunit M n=1 Tax=Mycoplasmoides fastidiosum TaxID=92758 RepID=UPI00296243E7|nr:type I restriction-modification system subunit M [Mycoplasmoides fastidiosum]
MGYFFNYDLSYEAVLEKIAAGENIIPTIQDAFNQIENSSVNSKSESNFKGLFNDVKLDDTKLGNIEREREIKIKRIIQELSDIQLTPNDHSIDFLGDVYEYLLSNFASNGGKKAGEFYTPESVSELIVRIATHGRKSLKSVYDPACGSGSLLIRILKNAQTQNIKVQKLYGQEIKSSTFNLARMNLFLRGLTYFEFDIREGDTLIDPKHLNLDLKFDCVVANPPFSLKWNPNETLLNDERYNEYRVLPPRNKADFAFLMHMLYNVHFEGVVVSIFSLGILERGNSEKKIRQVIIDKNYIDAIILMPERLFYNTIIATCIVIAKKNKKNDDILFINASQEFKKSKKQNFLDENNIQKIYQTWAKREEIPYFSKIISKKQSLKTIIFYQSKNMLIMHLMKKKLLTLNK